MTIFNLITLFGGLALFLYGMRLMGDGLKKGSSDAFKRAIHACIRQFRLNEALLVKNRDPHALHQARVAVRRMRSAFSIFRPMIGDDGAALRDELKWLASILGNARDLDVLAARMEGSAYLEPVEQARRAAFARTRCWRASIGRCSCSLGPCS